MAIFRLHLTQHTDQVQKVRPGQRSQIEEGGAGELRVGHQEQVGRGPDYAQQDQERDKNPEHH